MQHRSRQLEASRIPLLRQARELRATRIAQPEQLGRLVEGLASRVVDRFAQQRVLAHAAHPHQLRMSAGNQQRNEGKGRGIGRQQGRQQMPLKVMHRQSRHAARQGERLGHAGTDQQRTRQPGASGVGDGVDVLDAQRGRLQHLLEQQRQAADVVTRGELRHDATVRRVQIHLRVQAMAQQPATALARVVDRDAGFVA